MNLSKARSLFRHPEIGQFFQVQPKLENPFLGDGLLQRILQRWLPSEMEREVSKELTIFGDRVVRELEPLGIECELNQPKLEQFDAWGKRIDKIVTCDAWKKIKDISAEEGIISIGYERKFGEYSRLVQIAKLLLYSPSSGLFSCPIAASDGAAKTIEALKIDKLREPFERLTTRDPKRFWTSGQWMTERKGGSDVGNGTETLGKGFSICLLRGELFRIRYLPIAREDNGKFDLYGYKWFTSTIDSEMSLTLARITGNNNQNLEGSKGLSMFFIKMRKDDGSINNIQVMKLKNKLGTRQLPTGEILLDGAEAELASDCGRGVAAISNMLTITRIHNASASISFMRRILSLSRDYSTKRKCFGLPIAQYPLHIETLANLELQARGGTAFILEIARLLGATECSSKCGVNSEEELLLRLFTPLAKLYTGKKCIGVISEGLESFGGQGYIEDTHLPKILRDAQVTPIWEGTTNILSLDVLRAILKSKGQVLYAMKENVERRLKESVKLRPELQNSAEIVDRFLKEILEVAPQVREISAREFSFALSEVIIGTLLIEHGASKYANQSDIICALRWVQQITSIKEKIAALNSSDVAQQSYDLVFDSFNEI